MSSEHTFAYYVAFYLQDNTYDSCFNTKTCCRMFYFHSAQFLWIKKIPFEKKINFLWENNKNPYNSYFII